ncbi:histidine kinase dimerization/phosphoacceptor domain -containing protein [Methanolacinia paynteri]|uniref:histidine kinase dimerization/phosphoacceptor domain -containing protein n=1 Tax=Methanolacinia paynteri TaxID=230356 RepID=UPI00064E37CA|nr:histidine kinase dimerization/phosphoacceptor domain -containing protein [Methanolacinia paynteri]
MAGKGDSWNSSSFVSGLNDKKDFLIAASVLTAFILIAVFYSFGYTTVTPHLMDVPIILCAFFYPKRGVAAAVILSAGYVLMAALLTGFSGIEIIYAVGRAVIFIMIGTVVSFISEGLNNEKKRYSDLFNNLSDTTYITSCTADGEIGEIVECNETTLKNTGYKKEELIGKPVSTLIGGTVPSLRNTGNETDDTEKINGEGIYVFETGHKRKDRPLCPVEMKIRSSLFDKKPVFIITARDISRRKETEDKLTAQAKFLESLIETIPIPFMYKDHDLRHTMCNTPLLNSLYLKKEDFIGKTVYDVLPAECADEINKMDLETITSHQPVSKTLSIPLKNGGEYVTLVNTMAVFSEEEEFSGIITISQDISNLKKVKEDLRRSLEEKTVLLQEVHHRVKNNLAIIIGFLSMQKTLMDDEECIEAIADAGNRIYSLAAVHESIYLSENISEIDAGDHFKNLIGSILTTCAEDSTIRYSIDTGGCKLDIRQAIPASLIVNEIITNSVKYAFRDLKSGNISLKLHKDENGRFSMVISDNGIGLPEGFDQSKSHTLGIKVINNIVRLQLKGDVSLISGSSGTAWNISWK